MDYLVQKSRPAAARVLNNLEQKCQLRAQFPLLGASREDLAPGLRGFPVGKFVIFYKPLPDGIEVIRVLHGARDIPNLFQP